MLEVPEDKLLSADGCVNPGFEDESSQCSTTDTFSPASKKTPLGFQPSQTENEFGFSEENSPLSRLVIYLSQDLLA